MSRFFRVAALTLLASSPLLAQRGGGRGGFGGPDPFPVTLPADDERVARLKTEAVRLVDSMSTLTQQMVDQVFSFGELGFQEVETSKYLTGVLEKNGFTVQRGFAGIPTGGWPRGARASPSSRSAPTSTAFRRRRRSRASPTTIRSSPARRATVKDTTRACRSTSRPRSRSSRS